MITEEDIMGALNLSSDAWDALPDAVRAKLAAQAETIARQRAALLETKRCTEALQETDEFPPDTCPADLYDMVCDALESSPAQEV